jgi:hypothetical protein
MPGIKFFALAIVVVGIFFSATAPKAQAQVGVVGVNIGVAPDCPYGYFDYAPYNCVPDGYYGSEWFKGGVFIGVGPWFHASSDFQGKVDNRFDPLHGYTGSLPKVGDKPAAQRKDPQKFRGNESRDGRGHRIGAHGQPIG